MFVARDICLAASLFPILLFLSLSGIGSWLLPMIWVLAVFMLPLRLVIGMALIPIAVSPTIVNVVVGPFAIVSYITASKLKKKKFLACFVANMFPYTGLVMLWSWPVMFGALASKVESYGIILVMVGTTILITFAATVVALAFSIPLAILQVKVLKIIETRLGVMK